MSGNWRGDGAMWRTALGGAGLIITTVVIVGGPSVFYDTDAYLALGRADIALVGRILQHLLHPAATGLPPIAKDPTGLSWEITSTRSTVFSLLLATVERFGTLWGFVALQAVTLSYVLTASLCNLVPGVRPRETLTVIAFLCVATSAPFFAGFAMPDVWLGIGLLAAMNLMLCWSRMGVAGRTGMAACLFAMLSFHLSNLPVAAAAVTGLLAAGAVLRWPSSIARRGVAVFGGVAAATVALNLMIAQLATGATHRPPLTLPFLTARIMVDGPGLTYLRTSCAKGRRWTLCRLSGVTPATVDQWLWWKPEDGGVYRSATPDEQRRIKLEEPAFVREVLLDDPFGEAAAAARNALLQFLLVNVDEPLTPPDEIASVADVRRSWLPGALRRVGCDPLAPDCRPRFSKLASDIWHVATFWLAAALIVWRLAQRDLRDRIAAGGAARTLVLAVGFLVAALVANAVVTGVISAPVARYQSRAAWVLPFMALIVVSRFGFRPGPATSQDRS